MAKLISILFAFFCFGTSALSSKIMGAGMWFWIIITAGALVAIFQHSPQLRIFASTIALIFSIGSVCAVLLGLVAATIGGSFRLENQEALLLFLFAMIALSGFALYYLNKNSKSQETS